MSDSKVTSRVSELERHRMLPAVTSQQKVQRCRASWVAEFRDARLLVYHFLREDNSSRYFHISEGLP